MEKLYLDFYSYTFLYNTVLDSFTLVYLYIV